MSYCTNSKNKKWNNIMEDFEDKIILCFTNEETPYCIYDLCLIYFKYDVYKNPTENDLFDLLHEIGHIMTNKVGMKRCMEEYLATQWALDNSKKYNVKISKKRIQEFQDYIWKWRDIGIKHNAKIIPSKLELTLKAS